MHGTSRTKSIGSLVLRFVSIATFITLVAVGGGTATNVNAQHLGGDMASGRAFSTISSDFERIYRTPSSEEVISGSFHYLGQNDVFFEVTEPLHQIIIVKKTETIIYYPARKSGFRFKGGKGIQILPMIPGVVASLRQDYGLGELGYELHDQTVVGDTLMTFWRNTIAGEALGEFRLARFENNLEYVVYSPPDNSHPIRTSFYDHTLVGDVVVPLRLETETTTKEGPSTGILKLSGLAFDRTIPARVRQFEIPKDAKLQDRSW